MSKGRLLIFTSAIICAFALSAVPAFAEFEATGTALKGAGKSGETVFEGGGGKVVCTSAEGTWTLESKLSENLKLNVEKWNSCTTVVFGSKTSATLSACELQIHQPTKGQLTATGSVLSTACTIKASLCEIKVGKTGNQELKTVNLSNNGSKELVAAAAIEGITTTVSSGCALGGVKATKEAKLKGTSTASGVMEV